MAAVDISTLENGRLVIREHTFWWHRPQQGFPTPAIRHIEDYDGADRLNLCCTQTGLKPGAQKKLVEAWCEYLPTLTHLKYLWFNSRVSQDLFDAATQVPGLVGLYVKWGGVEDFSSIAALKKLKALHMASTPSLEPLDSLKSLRKLEWLELFHIRAASDLAFLRHLPQLRALAVEGDSNSIKNLHIRSLEPLTHLKKLEWLGLTLTLAPDEDLIHVSKLPALRFLSLSSSHRMPAIADLAGRIPHVTCSSFSPIQSEPGHRCRKCCQPTMILLIGKGIPFLCKDCDAARIAKHVEQFERIAAEAAKDGGASSRRPRRPRNR